LTPLILFQQLQNFSKFGNHISLITEFYATHLHQPCNPILQALASALREYCEFFFVELSKLATRCESLTLLELESVLAPKRRDIEILAQVLRKMGAGATGSNLRQEDGVVLGTLYDSACEMSLLGDAQGMGILFSLTVLSYSSLPPPPPPPPSPLSHSLTLPISQSLSLFYPFSLSPIALLSPLSLIVKCI
jgi:hypothetical protein